MLFNSLEFFLFLPLVFIIYWWVVNKSLKAQNILILIASYVFYGWWDWRFLFLIAFSTIVDYYCGLAIYKAEKPSSKKLFIGISLFVNLGLLIFFKYFNFFIESWVDAWASVGVTMHTSTLNLILPVGISFYTFQTLSYSIDIYRGTFKPTKDIIAFSAFVSFFPQLVAGPIERASNLLPQFSQQKKIQKENLTKGARLIVWGLFKKVAIADMLATSVNLIFENYETTGGLELLVGALLFTFQIYCDFSGYSDIAIGTAKLFGYDLMTNFKFPFFSRDIIEFWSRWHISLSTWLNDYIYAPLSIKFRYYGKHGLMLAIFITFLISGFWHGANWTFVSWGAIHGLLYLPLIYKGRGRLKGLTVAQNSILPDLRETRQLLITFILVMFSLVLFRSSSISQMIAYVENIFLHWNNYGMQFSNPTNLLLILSLVIYEWINRRDEQGIFNHKSRILNYTLISAAIWMIIINASNGKQEFIYFQF